MIKKHMNQYESTKYQSHHQIDQDIIVALHVSVCTHKHTHNLKPELVYATLSILQVLNML